MDNTPEQAKRFTRREFLRMGGASIAGLLLIPHALNAPVAAHEQTPLPQPTPEKTVKRGQVLFDFLAEVDQSDREKMRAAIKMAESYFDGFGVALTRDVRMTVRAGVPTPGVSSGGGGDYGFFWYTKMAGWTNEDDATQKKGLIHEYSHMVQRDLMKISTNKSPTWINEGSAEVFAEDALIKQGLLSMEQVKALRLPYFQKDGKQVLPLTRFELFDTKNPWSIDWQVYNVSTLAVRELINVDHVEKLIQFYQQIPECDFNWKKAFSKAFGKTVEEFYEQFEPRRQEGISILDTPVENEITISDEKIS